MTGLRTIEQAQSTHIGTSRPHSPRHVRMAAARAICGMSVLCPSAGSRDVGDADPLERLHVGGVGPGPFGCQGLPEPVPGVLADLAGADDERQVLAERGLGQPERCDVSERLSRCDCNLPSPPADVTQGGVRPCPTQRQPSEHGGEEGTRLPRLRSVR